MEIRKTTLEDMDIVMGIYDHARQYMRIHGNLHQWTKGYPSKDLIHEDIQAENSFVCIEDSQIVGVFCFTLGIDPTYIKIYEGNWLNEKPYGVVHRIASASHKQGVASFCLDWCYQQSNNIRIDTHRDNIVMHNLLRKNGYVKCGIIYLQDGSERLAYHKSGYRN